MARDNLKHARPIAMLKEGRTDWYSIENRADGTTELMIYDEIGYFGVTARDLINDLSKVKGDITARINTPGGEVFEGLAIYNALKTHPGKVTVIVEALAASIGSVIAMAGDHVVMAKNAELMIHDGHGMCIGNAADMQYMIDQLNRASNNIASIYAERAGGTTDEWRKRMQDETWFNAAEAVKAGLADEVQGQPIEPDKTPKDTWDLSIFKNIGRSAAPDPFAILDTLGNDKDKPDTPVIDWASVTSSLRGVFG